MTAPLRTRSMHVQWTGRSGDQPVLSWEDGSRVLGVRRIVFDFTVTGCEIRAEFEEGMGLDSWVQVPYK